MKKFLFGIVALAIFAFSFTACPSPAATRVEGKINVFTNIAETSKGQKITITLVGDEFKFDNEVAEDSNVPGLTIKVGDEVLSSKFKTLAKIEKKDGDTGSESDASGEDTPAQDTSINTNSIELYFENNEVLKALDGKISVEVSKENLKSAPSDNLKIDGGKFTSKAATISIGSISITKAAGATSATITPTNGQVTVTLSDGALFNKVNEETVVTPLIKVKKADAEEPVALPDYVTVKVAATNADSRTLTLTFAIAENPAYADIAGTFTTSLDQDYIKGAIGNITSTENANAKIDIDVE